MSQHTPGPWKTLNRGTNRLVDIVQGSDASNGLAKVWLNEYRKRGATPERLANARLIAAAPELLEALERILTTHDDSCQGAECGIAGIDAARAAIAKAKGE
jgi:hypothetical protein